MAKECLPTNFAIAMAMSVDLYIADKDSNTDIDEWSDYRGALINFQEMSITEDLEMCLTAYYGIDLEERQIEVLEMIHKTTKSWLMGNVMSQVINKINSNIIDGKDMANLSQLILENMNPKKGNMGEEKRRGLLVTFSESGGDVSKIKAEEV